jgi:hypothetical protein
LSTVGQVEGDSAGTDAFIAKLNPAGNALAYSTYLGGSDVDQATAIAVDSSGAAYVAGLTNSADFNTVAEIEGHNGGVGPAGIDAFIAKLNPSGNALAYSTYLGGSDVDQATAIAVDPSGAAYVAGFTESTDFDTVGQIEGDDTGRDAFIAKLNPTGGALAYSTYLGGSSPDAATAIAVDPSGAAFVAGYTDSIDFNSVGPIEGSTATTDAFIAKLNPAGSALVYSTHLGGNGADFGTAIAVDPSGAAYVAGYTSSTNFNTVGQIEGDSAGADAFIAKLNPSGNALAYSTYLGGNVDDLANAIAVDSSGAAYVTGYTTSADFDTAGPIEGDSAGTDAFIAKLNPAGNALAYSTYLGGSDFDQANAIAVDASGAAYVAGYTNSINFNTVGPIEGDSAAADAFIAKLTAPDTRLLSGPAEGSATSDATPTFTFSSDNPTATFECRTDGGPWEGCESPRTLPALGDGDHTFKVRALDDVGNFDLMPVVRNFDIDTTPPPVDTTPPDVFFTSGPSGLTNDNTPSFGFAMSEAGTLQCRVDGSQFQTCTSPRTTSALTEGPHTFSVRATDSAGNRSVVDRSILVDTTAPQTQLAPVPAKLTAKKKKAKTTFSFSASEAGSTFQCSLDGAPFSACTSPLPASLKVGTHTFAVRATDKAANTDASPAQATVKVKKKKKKRRSSRAQPRRLGD